MHPLLSLFIFLLLALTSTAEQTRLNIFFFTSDDMNYDSTGICGGPIKDLTSNINKLATEGMRFDFAYSTVAVCQPVRSLMESDGRSS